MIQDSNLNDCSHYFDSQGRVHYIEIDSSLEFNPKPMAFLLQNGRIMNLFLENNPWRATSGGEHADMVYQYCVFCKKKRFENKTFNAISSDFKTIENIIRPGSGETKFTCPKLSCSAGDWFYLTDNIAKDKFYPMFFLDKINKLPEIIAKEQLHLKS